MTKLHNKHITLISLNFYPEDTAIGMYSTQLAEYLEAQGAKITVITGFPYYPQWEIWSNYKEKESFLEEKIGTMRILRYKQYVPKKPTFLKRVLHIIDFTLGTRKNLRRIKECNLVISIIPFTSSAWLGNTLSRKHNAKHWIHIQDFEFDAAFQSGLTSKKKSKGFFYNRLMSLEKKILDKAYRVSTISHTMLGKLKNKTETPTYFLPNWIDIEASDPAKIYLHPYIKENKFTVLYAGNIGDKQDWELFRELVSDLDFNEYQVVVVGAGAKMEVLKVDLSHLPIDWHKPVPLDQLASLLASADVHILFQKTEVKDTVMPSKILGMMASARPSIVTGNAIAEPAKIFKESQGGFYESEPDKSRIMQHLQWLKNNPILAKEMGVAARAYSIDKFAKGSILERFTDELTRL